MTAGFASPPPAVPSEVLYGVARRLDAGRRFLLVSRVLGKHIPVAPGIPLAAGAALALRLVPAPDPRQALVTAALGDAALALELWRSVREEPVECGPGVAVIGFAETATGLGHAVAACIRGATYHQTTRRRLGPGGPPVAVDEIHSHAREQWLWSVPRASRRVIIVDDELSTGRTAQALMEAVQPAARATEYTLLALCDSIDAARRKALATAAAALGASLSVASLHALDAAPEVPDVGEVRCVRDASAGAVDAVRVCSGGPLTGRRRNPDHELCDAVARRIATEVRGRLPGAGRIHVLGTGEFLHLPMLVALALGDRVRFSATTRSPIAVCARPGYPVTTGIAFTATDGADRTEYAYNLRAGDLDALVVVTEDPPELLAPLVAALVAGGLPAPLVVAVGGADG